MNVLVACEYSGRVRDAFLARGHDAYSCDLLPTEADPARHIQDDVRKVLRGRTRWDMLIGFPECTYLTYAGAKHLYIDGRKENGRDEERWEKMRKGAEFFRELLTADVERKALENPVMLAVAQRIVWRRPSQSIQPWMFGHAESKRTCFWLEKLPLLIGTKNVYAEMMLLPKKLRNRIHYAGPGPNRWKERSRTFPGIADAMGDQWGRADRNYHQPSLFGEAA